MARMSSARYDGVDLPAAAGAALALVMTMVYVALLSAEGDPPALWYLASLVVATLLCGYGAVRAAPWRRPALIVAGLQLVVLGLLGIFSVGAPILVAGVLALYAATRRDKTAVVP